MINVQKDSINLREASQAALEVLPNSKISVGTMRRRLSKLIGDGVIPEKLVTMRESPGRIGYTFFLDPEIKTWFKDNSDKISTHRLTNVGSRSAFRRVSSVIPIVQDKTKRFKNVNYYSIQRLIYRWIKNGHLPKYLLHTNTAGMIVVDYKGLVSWINKEYPERKNTEINQEKLFFKSKPLKTSLVKNQKPVLKNTDPLEVSSWFNETVPETLVSVSNKLVEAIISVIREVVNNSQKPRIDTKALKELSYRIHLLECQNQSLLSEKINMQLDLNESRKLAQEARQKLEAVQNPSVLEDEVKTLQSKLKVILQAAS